jgi:UPF0716 protein FxsA
MPLLALAVVFIVVPLLELYVILQVPDLLGGGVTGVLITVAILAADSLIGAILLRSQGRAVWRRFNETLAGGSVPHREVIDGVLVIFGGAFLITPGFLTDIVGLLLLIPPTRAVIRGAVTRRLGRRVAVNVAGRPRRMRDPYDVEGTATEYDAPPGRLER